jgi:hypothetical protein
MAMTPIVVAEQFNLCLANFYIDGKCKKEAVDKMLDPESEFAITNRKESAGV